MKTKRVYVVTWRSDFQESQEYDDGAKAFEKVVELADDGYTGVRVAWRDVWEIGFRTDPVRTVTLPAGTPIPDPWALRVIFATLGLGGIPVIRKP